MVERARETAKKLRDLDALRELLPVAQSISSPEMSRGERGAAHRLVYAIEQNIRFLELVESSSRSTPTIKQSTAVQVSPLVPPLLEPTAPVENAPVPQFCANCGARLVERANFCPSCGAQARRIANGAAPAPPVTDAPVVAAPQVKKGWFAEGLPGICFRLRSSSSDLPALPDARSGPCKANEGQAVTSRSVV